MIVLTHEKWKIPQGYLTKEFKRRTKPMEIAAGERACHALLTFICLKMELHWR